MATVQFISDRMGMKVLILNLVVCLALVDYAQGAEASCCQYLTLDSDGFAENYQESRLGQYQLMGTSQAGYPIYKQAAGANFLYFQTDVMLWIVGLEIGVDYGGILNRELGHCPDQLGMDWEYYRDWTDTWEKDWLLTATCNGNPGPDPTTPGPDHEPCTFGDVCYNCNVWSEVNGVRYCCANNCNSGGIHVDSQNGQVNCYCYH